MRLFLACGLLLLSITARGSISGSIDGRPLEPMTSDSLVQSETEAQAYLARIDRLLAMASAGTYGALRRGAAKDLQAARDGIASVLESRATLDGLREEDRLAIQNAEDTISAILRNDDKARMVCKRATKTGTRFSTTECMTVAQREARAISAAQATGQVQRENCIPTVDNPCG